MQQITKQVWDLDYPDTLHCDCCRQEEVHPQVIEEELLTAWCEGGVEGDLDDAEEVEEFLVGPSLTEDRQLHIFKF